jgi:aldose 1-epimerase
VAGRIADAAFTLDGHTYQLARNDPPNHLHGGVKGFDKRLWKATAVDREDGAPSLRLSYDSADGEEGYPGNVRVAVTYTVTNQNEFLIESEAVSDRTTPLSLTHHSYFNLAGESSGSIADHRLEIFASEFVPVDENLIATGRVESTAGNGDIFRAPRRVGDAIGRLFQGHGDLYALPKGNGSAMRVAARLEDPASGRVMTVSTTQDYLQLYTGSQLNCSSNGKSGTMYGRHAGICLECEGYPDAANAARREEILLRPGQTQHHATAYAFSVAVANAATQD